MIVLSYLQNMIFFYHLNSISDLHSQFLLLNFMLFVVCSVARIDLKGIAEIPMKMNSLYCSQYTKHLLCLLEKTAFLGIIIEKYKAGDFLKIFSSFSVF